MYTPDDYKEISPIVDEEIQSVATELSKILPFIQVAEAVLPGISVRKIKELLASCKEFGDFQKNLSFPFLKGLLSRTSLSFKAKGMEHIDKSKAFTAISNHRDIILDAAFLNVLTHENGLPFSEVAIGDNLLIYPWIEKLARLNGCFIVKRDTTIRELFASSMLLSSYIHHNLTVKNRSVWIAQREGRAKDSNDRTQEALVKMLAMGSEKPFLDSLLELNIAPLSLSYEYDPCDYLKACEFQLKRDDPDYKKSSGDDLVNMQVGVLGYKGNITFTFGRPITSCLEALKEKALDKNEMASAVAEIIDHEIHLHYTIYPINYYAYDKIMGSNQYRSHYEGEPLIEIEEYFEDRMDRVALDHPDREFLLQKMYEMYANPLINHLHAQRIENT